MTNVNAGFYVVDGPPPQAPLYTLVGASRVITNDLDRNGIPRWGNGVQVYGFPTGYADSWDPCSTGSDREKADGDPPPIPKFSSQVVPFAETCSSYGIWGGDWDEAEAQERFVARVVAAMEATESASIERELMNGNALGTGETPYLADGNGTFPWGDVATSVGNAIGVLEDAIASTGRRGWIHCSPAFATAAARKRLVQRDDRSGTLQTILGTVMVPGDGYVDAIEPHDHAAPGATQEWVYATGPVDVRRDQIAILPDNVAAALDRGIGGRPNSITYRAERLVVASWDTALQAAVLADRCSDDCGSPPS